MAKKDAARARYDKAREPGAPPTTFARYAYNREEKKLVTLIVIKGAAEPTAFDCSQWLGHEEIAIAFADALSTVGKHMAFRTCDQHVIDLTFGFFAYCDSTERSDLRLRDINFAFIEGFIKFLSKLENDGTFVHASTTRLHRLGTLRAVINTLKAQGYELSEDCEVRANPWPGATRDVKKETVPLDYPTAAKLLLYCQTCVIETIRDVEEIWRIEAKSRDALKHTVIDQNFEPRTRGEAIVWLKEMCDGYLPERKKLKAEGGKMFAVVEQFGFLSLVRAFGPYAGDLAPFVYYLAFRTAMNGQPLLDLKASEVLLGSILGEERVKLASLKHRGNGIMRPGLSQSSDPSSPYYVLKFLLRWTEDIRQLAQETIKDQLFLYVPRNSRKGEAFNSYFQGGKGKSPQFNQSTIQICKRAGVPWIGFRRIRSTAGDIGDSAFGGDLLKVAQLLQQKNVSTTERHYRAGGPRRRQSEALAHGITLRQRWIDSSGTIDPRNVHSEHDQTAATPGWGCLDPLSSPLRGQEAGRLCTAYGDCPNCPLAVLDIASVYAAGRCLQLKQAYRESRDAMGPISWEVRWSAAARELCETWLPQFSEQMLAKVASLNLPPLPALD